MRIFLILASLLAAQTVYATAPARVAADVAAAYTQENGKAIVQDFMTFLRLPNYARDTADIDANASWVVDYLAERGFASEIWREGGGPYIYSERRVEGAEKTLLIYAHFDGQPVAHENWASPPFEPTLRTDSVERAGEVLTLDEAFDLGPDMNWRLFARSAGDDKGPIIALAAALDAMDAAGLTPSVNIKLILDGEEEIGSPTLPQVLAKHAETLAADLMLFCDGPMHQSGLRQLVFGVRGSMTIDLTTYGPARPLHSGHYGNFAPHPSDDLVRLLSSFKNDRGEVVVIGFDRGIVAPTQAEKDAIERMPKIDSALKRGLELARVEGGGDRIELLMMRPALIIKGIQAGGVGDKSRNIILPEAQASLNIRMVPGQSVENVSRAIVQHIVSRGFTPIPREPTVDEKRNRERLVRVDIKPGAYPAYRSALDGPEATALANLIADIDGAPPLLTPTMGGSLPINLVAEALETPIILLPIANHDNNQHGRDENIRLGNLFDAIRLYAGVLAGLGPRLD